MCCAPKRICVFVYVHTHMCLRTCACKESQREESGFGGERRNLRICARTCVCGDREKRFVCVPVLQASTPFVTTHALLSSLASRVVAARISTCSAKSKSNQVPQAARFHCRLANMLNCTHTRSSVLTDFGFTLSLNKCTRSQVICSASPAATNVLSSFSFNPH